MSTGDDLLRLVLATALALAAAPLLAQMPALLPVRTTHAGSSPGTYDVDTGHTQVLFTVNHLGFTEYTGQFTAADRHPDARSGDAASGKVEVELPDRSGPHDVAALDTHLDKPLTSSTRPNIPPASSFRPA